MVGQLRGLLRCARWRITRGPRGAEALGSGNGGGGVQGHAPDDTAKQLPIQRASQLRQHGPGRAQLPRVGPAFQNIKQSPLALAGQKPPSSPTH